VLARFVELPGLDVKFTEILERPLVLRVEIERLAVERVGLFPVSGLAQAESHQIVDIGMLVGLQHRRQLRERAGKILRLEPGAHRGEIRCVARRDGVDGKRAGGRQSRCCEQQ
jgi:hypothetical protein